MQKQEQQINSLLKSSHQQLLLMSEKRKLLETRVKMQEQMVYQGTGVQPFFYSAIGSDEEPGIVLEQNENVAAVGNFIGAENNYFFRGFMSVHEDAPFIWTHLGVTLRFLENTSPATETVLQQEDSDLASVFNTAEENSAFTLATNLDIGFIEGSSGRVLFQSQEKSDNPQFDGQRGLFPVTLFNLNQSNAVTNVQSPLHGPTGLYQLPSEVEIPAAGTIETILRSNIVLGQGYQGRDNPRFRAYVTFGGYKILA